MTIDPNISLGDLLTILGLAFGIITFGLQNRREHKVQKIELYHRLESGSIELFKFEAAQAERLAPFQTMLREQEPAPKDEPIARKFYEQTMNLFEMASRFRLKDIIEPEVYGSWVIWYYDTLLQWGFREQWPDLRQNYTKELRVVFDRFVAEFDPAEDDVKRKRRFFKHVADVTPCHIIGEWLDQLEKESKHLRFQGAT